MSYITICELFPMYITSRKWGTISKKEIVRIEKEYTIVTTQKSFYIYEKYSIEFKIDGKFSKSDGPAHIGYDEFDNIRAEWWYKNGKLHRNDGPSLIEYRENGIKSYESWSINDKGFNSNRPIWIQYRKNGKIKEQEWLIDKGFITKRYDKNGNLLKINFFSL